MLFLPHHMNTVNQMGRPHPAPSGLSINPLGPPGNSSLGGLQAAPTDGPMANPKAPMAGFQVTSGGSGDNGGLMR